MSAVCVVLWALYLIFRGVFQSASFLPFPGFRTPHPKEQRMVYNGSTTQPYVNPKAPVHIIAGSAGCRERTDQFNPHPKEWSAFRSTDYGYTRMQVMNSTHLYLEQVSDDQYGKVIDSIWLVKEKHGVSAWL